MTRHLYYEGFRDDFEYHGNTAVERVRRQGGKTVWRDWILFDSVEEAQAYFNDQCADFPVAGREARIAG